MKQFIIWYQSSNFIAFLILSSGIEIPVFPTKFSCLKTINKHAFSKILEIYALRSYWEILNF